MAPTQPRRKTPHRTSDRTYLRRRDALRRREDPCWICQAAIDYTLDYRDPMSFTADHIDPVSLGGDNRRGELQAAHRSCNARRGNRVEFTNSKPPNMTNW